MKILISGYYGFNNLGDDSVLQAMIVWLRRKKPQLNITVLSAAPDETSEQYEVRAVNRSNPFALVSELFRTDLLLSGGGTLFQNATSNLSLIYYLGLILLAKLLRKKVVVFAQGFGPLEGALPRLFTCLILNRVDLITLRDQESAAQLKQIGVKNKEIKVTADPALLLTIPEPSLGDKLLNLEGIAKKKPLLGIAVRSHKGPAFKTLAQAINWLASEHGFYPVFLLFQGTEDAEAAAEVITNLGCNSTIIFRKYKPEEMLALFSHFDLFIGMRLHSLIFAAMNNISMLGLSYDPKVGAFMESIGHPYVKIDQDISFEMMKNILEKVLGNKDKNRRELNLRIEEMRKKASDNFNILESLRLGGIKNNSLKDSKTQRGK